MKPAHDGMKVSIMGREFVVACPIEEVEALTEAAEYLDDRMRDVQQSGRVVGLERCAIMAALNIAHELLGKERDSQVTQDTRDRLRLMSEKISTVIDIDMGADVGSSAQNVDDAALGQPAGVPTQDSSQAAI